MTYLTRGTFVENATSMMGGMVAAPFVVTADYWHASAEAFETGKPMGRAVVGAEVMLMGPVVAGPAASAMKYVLAPLRGLGASALLAVAEAESLKSALQAMILRAAMVAGGVPEAIELAAARGRWRGQIAPRVFRTLQTRWMNCLESEVRASPIYLTIQAV